MFAVQVLDFGFVCAGLLLFCFFTLGRLSSFLSRSSAWRHGFA